MQLTLREISKLRVPVLIWGVLTVVAAVAGPFGTMQAMGPVGRALYWGAVIACSIGLNIGANRLALGRAGPASRACEDRIENCSALDILRAPLHSERR